MKNPRVIAIALVGFLFTSLIPLQIASATPIGTGLSLYYKSDSAAWTTTPRWQFLHSNLFLPAIDPINCDDKCNPGSKRFLLLGNCYI